MSTPVFNKEYLNVGSFPDSGDGDKLRDASIKINANLDEIYGGLENIYLISDSKVDTVEGETLTPNKFTDTYKLKLDSAESVTGAQAKADTAEQNAKTYFDNQLVDVQSDIDNRALINETGFQLTKDELNSIIYLRDKNYNIISTLSVSFLNNEGTTIEYNSSTNEIELRDKDDNLLSKFSTTALVSGVAHNHNLNGSILELRDSSNNVLSTVNLTIANISNLQDELDSKESIVNVDTKVLAAETNAINWAKSWGLGTTSPNFDGDLNDIDDTSFLFASTDSLNKPTTQSGWVITIPQSNLHATQMFFNSGATNGLFMRIKNGGVWSSWIEMESISGAQNKANIAESNANNYTDTQLSTKVDKDGTKQLSDENYTLAEKDKLSTAESITGAQAKADTAEQNAKDYADAGDAGLQSQIDSINSGDDYVNSTGDEDVSGVKTFIDNTNFQSNITVSGNISEGGVLLSDKYETPLEAQNKADIAESNAKTYADTQLSTKVDKDGAKQLSDENYTTNDMNLLHSLKTDSFYEYVQNTPDSEWVVTHNLNKKPSVQIFNNLGIQMIGMIIYNDLNTLTINFNGNYSGFAIIN
jgi:hypothetical protein